MLGLHNLIMVNVLFCCRCIGCQRRRGRLIIALTVSVAGAVGLGRTRGFAPTEGYGGAFEVSDATGRMYPAPTGSAVGAFEVGSTTGDRKSPLRLLRAAPWDFFRCVLLESVV